MAIALYHMIDLNSPLKLTIIGEEMMTLVGSLEESLSIFKTIEYFGPSYLG